MLKYQFSSPSCLFCLIVISLLFSSCPQKEQQDLDTSSPSAADILIQMEEKEIAINRSQNVFAQYAEPVSRYNHGILGDAIEASQLVVNVAGKFYQIELSEQFVFEDIRPRLVDVDLDGTLEFVCIRTNIDLGAGIVIYKIQNNTLKQYAFVEEIGNRNRWLNIVTINDLDEDGTIELVWVQTPHIGGILKVAKIESGKMEVIDQSILYSNHAIGQTNLCLSILTENEEGKRFYVPNHARDKIVGFSFQNDLLKQEEEINLAVDFSIPLEEQYSFDNKVMEEDNCIHP